MGSNKVNQSSSRVFNEMDDRDNAVYNPILGEVREDEGIDEKEWKQSQRLKSQGWWGTFKFFFKQSFKDIRRHKCQF